MNVEFYNKDNIADLNWPKNEWSEYVKNFFSPMIKGDIKDYIKNINVEIYILKYGEVILPLTVNSNNFENSYVCSPYAHYISYAREELYLIKNIFLRKVLLFIINIFSQLFKICQIDNVVIINNWFLSTNLYGIKLNKHILKKITFALEKKFPDKTLVFRSINKYVYGNLYYKLQDINYNFVGSRQIYIYSPNSLFTKNSRKKIKKDMKLLYNSEFKFSNPELELNKIRKYLDCYNSLYIEKYSKLNPQFSEKFIENGIKYDLFKFKVLLDINKNIVGILGYFIWDNIMTTPILGYKNIEGYSSEYLYKLLSIKLTSISNENNYILNRSSGASLFKLARGAKPAIEYSAIYNDHLSFYRKIPWLILKVIINKMGIPIMQKYKL